MAFVSALYLVLLPNIQHAIHMYTFRFHFLKNRLDPIMSNTKTNETWIQKAMTHIFMVKHFFIKSILYLWHKMQSNEHDVYLIQCKKYNNIYNVINVQRRRTKG